MEGESTYGNLHVLEDPKPNAEVNILGLDTLESIVSMPLEEVDRRVEVQPIPIACSNCW